jgi:uncharacterized membrane protein (DUF106 family)
MTNYTLYFQLINILLWVLIIGVIIKILKRALKVFERLDNIDNNIKSIEAKIEKISNDKF